jgi:RNA polymerase sigma-70 factor (ECF subfamily)
MLTALAMTDDNTRSLDLVLRAQAGDEAALNRLVERYYDRVRRIVRMRLGPKLRQSVESCDILQETFIAAVRALSNFEMRDEASLINWLSRLAERQIIAQHDHQSAKKRDQDRNVRMHGSHAPSTSGSLAGAPVDDRTSPPDAAAREERRLLVERCIAALPEEYRELIILSDYTGASWEAVAEATGRPSAAAARMMHVRARIELGKLLREAGVS